MRPRSGLALILLIALFHPLPAKAQMPMRDGLAGRLRVITLNRELVPEVARRHGVGTLELLAANWGLDLWKPETAESVILPTAHILPDTARTGIVVNRAEFRLYYFVEERLVMTVPIGIGYEEHETPLGLTRVVRKQKDPVWYPTPSTRADFPDLPASVPPGPGNPLGAHALYLGWPAYLIHGTIDDYGIGRRFTRGCVRLFPEHIAALFEMVPVGTPVTVVHQPVKLGWHENELFLEAHPSYDQLEELRVTAAFTLTGSGHLEPWIAAAAGERAQAIDWGAVRATLERRSGVPVQITNPRAHPVEIADRDLGF